MPVYFSVLEGLISSSLLSLAVPCYADLVQLLPYILFQWFIPLFTLICPRLTKISALFLYDSVPIIFVFTESSLVAESTIGTI